MPVINAAQTANTYPDNTGPGLPILSQIYNSRGGWFSVAGAAVFLQMQYGPQGELWWTEEVEVGAGAFAYLDKACTGVRFRSAVTGTPATVTAQIAQGPEPPLSIIALGQVGTTGIAPTRTIFGSPGSGNYSPPAGCLAILAELWGGGGGGGGAPATGATTITAGSGGSGGGYCSKMIAAPVGPIAFTVGAGGTGVAGAAGNPGGNTTFGALTASGGGGGAIDAASSSAPRRGGGAGGPGVGSGGDLNLQGQQGFYGLSLSAAVGVQGGTGGTGGDAPLGGVGSQQAAVVQGVPGSGGAGVFNSINAAAAAGQTGAAGLIVITEFY